MLSELAPRRALQTELERLRPDPALLQQLVSALLVAGLAELVLLRLVTRVGVHLPKSAPIAEALGVASFLGAFALNAASILATALLALVLLSVAWRASSAWLRWAALGFGATMFWGLAVGLTAKSPTADLAFGLSMTALLVTLGLLALGPNVSLRGRLALALIVGAYTAHQYYALGYLVYQQLGEQASVPAGVVALRLGELLVVLGGVGAFWAWGLERWRKAGRAGGAFALAPVAALLLGSFAPTTTTSILALWTTGLSLYLPLPLYLAALGLYLLTVASCLRSEDAFCAGAGLLLVLLAGYMPEATYYHVILALGVALLAGHGAARSRDAEADGGA